MLKLRNAVLTALLAFCLAMPFVSCSFNDGATGDVSGDVKVQSDNNQNGGNGGSTGGNSGGDEDSGDNGNKNPSDGNNGGSGNGGSTGGNGGSTGGNGGSTGGNEKPGEGTMYTVKYGDTVIVPAMSESALSGFAQVYGLVEGTDYTISGTTITLTEAGYAKVQAAGEGGGHGGIPPVTDGPVTDEPGTDEPGTDEPGTDEPGTDEPGTDEPVYGEGTVYTVMYNGQPLVDENGEVVKIPAAALDYYKTILSEGDYTINENVITLTDSGLKKVMDSGAGE